MGETPQLQSVVRGCGSLRTGSLEDFGWIVDRQDHPMIPAWR